VLWPDNHSMIEAVTYELNTSDTSKIVTRVEDKFIIADLTDSLISELDTIKYNSPGSEIHKFFPGLKIKSTRSYSRNPDIVEYYIFDHGAVKLAGYSTGDSLMPCTVFSNPLVIIPNPGAESDSSAAIKQNWSTKEDCFKKETRTKTIVRLVATGTLWLKGQKEEFLIYELTLRGDAKVNVGEQELIVPDAIFMQSKMLFTKTKGLIYEWSIKSKQTEINQQNPISQPRSTSYLELIQYNPINE
jgi:hypothetical protein